MIVRRGSEVSRGQVDNRCVGEIIGLQILWHVQWKCAGEPTVLQRSSENGLSLELENQAVFAEVRQGPQTMLCWSDGDIWLRK